MGQAATQKDEDEEDDEQKPAGTGKGPPLPVPDRRQQTSYSCGPACLRIVAEYFGIEVPEATLRKWADTNPEIGTTAEDLVATAEELGLSADLQTGLSLKEVAGHVAQNHPVIAGIQAWGTPEEEARGEAGHYVVVTGVEDDVVTLQDPAREAEAGKMEMSGSEFEQRWRLDEEGGGTVDRLGIILSKPAASGGKGDDWISQKVAKLRKEGKSEDQAVAIAYHMAQEAARRVEKLSALVEAKAVATPPVAAAPIHLHLPETMKLDWAQLSADNLLGALREAVSGPTVVAALQESLTKQIGEQMTGLSAAVEAALVRTPVKLEAAEIAKLLESHLAQTNRTATELVEAIMSKDDNSASRELVDAILALAKSVAEQKPATIEVKLPEPKPVEFVISRDREGKAERIKEE